MEVIENLHCSLGLLQQTLMISSADHYDLLGVYQAQPTKSLVNNKVDLCGILGWGGGRVRRQLLHPPAYGMNVNIFMFLFVRIALIMFKIAG